MDTLSIIILTAVINAFVTGVIGGIVLYRIQKKIDNSYFEHQTKFARIHEKRVEALETLYQKFIIITDNFTNILNEANTIDRKPTEFAKIHNVMQELDDFWKYLTNNRLFLPSNTTDEIYKIYFFAFRALNICNMFANRNLSPMAIRLLNYNIEAFKLEVGSGFLEVSSLDSEKPDLKSFTNSIRKELNNQIDVLENLYKSVADTPTK